MDHLDQILKPTFCWWRTECNWKYLQRSIYSDQRFKKISHNHFEKVKRSQCREGDIIIAKIGEYCYVVFDELNSESVISGNCCKLTVFEVNRILSIFFCYFYGLKGSSNLKLIRWDNLHFIRCDQQSTNPPSTKKWTESQIINFLTKDYVTTTG